MDKETAIANAMSIKDAANVHFKRKRLDEAAKLYDEALQSLESFKGAEFDFARATLLNNRSLCRFKNKDYRGSLSDAQNASVRRPKWSKPLYRMAEGFFAVGNYESALQSLDKAVAVAETDKETNSMKELRAKIENEIKRKTYQQNLRMADAEHRAKFAPKPEPAPPLPAPAAVEGEGEGEEEDVELGFVDYHPSDAVMAVSKDGKALPHRGPPPLHPDWSVLEHSKLGGSPVPLPGVEGLDQSPCCAHCKRPMLFLGQVYAPVEEISSAYHRVLYVYICARSECYTKANGGRGAAVVYRAQLPRDTPGVTSSLSTTSEEINKSDAIAAASSAISAASANPSHAAVATPGVAAKLSEMEIFFEMEPAPAAPESDDEDEDGLSDLNNSMAGLHPGALHEAAGMPSDTNAHTSDPVHRNFLKRIKLASEQCLRYSRWKNSGLLWPSTDAMQAFRDDAKIASARDKCEYCGAPRRFEMQVMPQLLFLLEVEDAGFTDFDWSSLLVFSCSRSCSTPCPRKEFIWIVTADAD